MGQPHLSAAEWVRHQRGTHETDLRAVCVSPLRPIHALEEPLELLGLWHGGKCDIVRVTGVTVVLPDWVFKVCRMPDVRWCRGWLCGG